MSRTEIVFDYGSIVVRGRWSFLNTCEASEKLRKLQDRIAKDYGCRGTMVSSRTNTEFIRLDSGGLMLILTGWSLKE